MPALQVRGQPHPHHVPERRGRHRPHRVALGLPRLRRAGARASCPSSRTPTGSTSTPRSSSSCTRPGCRIAEIPIPTYYGDEICYVDGMKYAKDVTKDVLRYRAHKMGFGTGEMAFASDAYEVKEGADTSHGRILRWMALRPPSRILDLGCSDGELGGRARGHGPRGGRRRHRGAQGRAGAARPTSTRPTSTRASRPRWATTSTWCSPPTSSSTCGTPEQLLVEIRAQLAPGGSVVTSIPNFGHWYPRAAGGARAVSTTTPAASSTGATCGSSPVEASSASSRGGVGDPPQRGHRPAARGRGAGRRHREHPATRALPRARRVARPIGLRSRSGRSSSPTSSSTSSSDRRRPSGPWLRRSTRIDGRTGP